MTRRAEWWHTIQWNFFRSCESKPYTAARIGGDEFAVLLPAMDQRERGDAARRRHDRPELKNVDEFLDIECRAGRGIDGNRPGWFRTPLRRRGDPPGREPRQNEHANRQCDQRENNRAARLPNHHLVGLEV